MQGQDVWGVMDFKAAFFHCIVQVWEGWAGEGGWGGDWIKGQSGVLALCSLAVVR